MSEHYTPFPVALLPGPVGRYVEEAARSIHCDPAYTALPLLSALGASIGNTRRIGLKSGACPWTEPPILWTAIVGYSGTAKSPALKAALWCVESRDRRAMLEAKQQQAENATAALRYEVELATWKRSGCKAGEPEPEKPSAPASQRFTVTDVTVEALADRLADNPRGLLLARDELSGWLRSFDQYKSGKGGDCAHWLSMYDASPLRIDRKTGERKTIYIPRAAVSICGGIQPDVLRAALGKEHFGDGLAARLLLAMPPRCAARWSEAEIPEASGKMLADVFDRLWGLEPEHDENGQPRPQIFGLTPEAKGVWIAYFNRHSDEQVELDGDLAAAWSKLRGAAARLALVVHLAEWAAGGDVDADRIDQSSIEAAIGLSDWFGLEARRVYALLGESDEDREERELTAWIENKGRRTTVRAVMRGPRQFRSEDKARAVLGRLVKKGRGRWLPEQGAGPGRPTSIFELLPGGDGDENTVSPEKTPIVSPSPAQDNENGRPLANRPAGMNCVPDELAHRETTAA